MALEIEQTVKRISEHPNVEGIMVLLNDGTQTVLTTTFSTEDTTKYTKLLLPFTALSSQCIRDVDPANELTFCKIQSDKKEIIVIPQDSFFVIVFTKNQIEQTA